MEGLEILTSMFDYQFVRMALVGGTLAAIVSAWIGLFLILRKESMLVDGVAHTAFGGVAVGLLLGFDPMLGAVAVSAAAVLGITYMRRKGMAQSDSAVAVMMATGFSLGMIIVSLANGFNVDLMTYLFGSILTVSRTDLLVLSALALFIIGFMVFFYKEMLAITFDEDGARLQGLPVQAMTVAFNLLVAVTIALSIKVIGIILVVALMVLPGLTALQLGRSFKATVVASTAFGTIAALAGIVLSVLFNVSTSGVIVFTAAGIFLFVAAYRRLG
ncbi:MAG TPA: metal ABC transporter permease [Methanomassiliicoccales archaeon]|jgi:zinc transport system permease protein|nr:metal ABC transporter permease [Methanomassiliicoccales archaeon]